ncbi:MAG: hypothetical protein ACRELC_11895 [Gemmatimonadota bacterium]
MRFDAILRAHGFMRTERPPALWEADTNLEPFLKTLGEMIALGLGRGNELAELTLNVSNMTVEPDEDPDEEGAWIPDGDYVAVTVRGAGAWEDDMWRAGQGPTRGILANVGPAADAAGAAAAYSRNLGSDGSVTVLLPRLESADTN